VEDRLDSWLVETIAKHPTGVHLLSFIERGGWFSADAFVEWMSRKLDSGSFAGKARAFSALTLKEFHAATGKDLSLVAANVSKGIKLVLNHRTAPQLPVVWAVRMSMSIPLLWQEVIWRAEWGEYRGHPLQGDTIVDGGLLSNFPIELFISDQKQVTEVMGEKRHENVLGLLIDESTMVEGAPPATAHKETEFDLMQLATVQRVLNLVTTMLEAHDKDVIFAFEGLVARMPAGGYGTTEFDMSEERRAYLVQTGYQAMKTYFEEKDKQPVSFSAPEAPSLAELADKAALRLLR
jgi:predicted acylesterase/phospholipase RssA